jgi:hypothetical protein
VKITLILAEELDQKPSTILLKVIQHAERLKTVLSTVLLFAWALGGVRFLADVHRS